MELFVAPIFTTCDEAIKMFCGKNAHYTVDDELISTYHIGYSNDDFKLKWHSQDIKQYETLLFKVFRDSLNVAELFLIKKAIDIQRKNSWHCFSQC